MVSIRILADCQEVALIFLPFALDVIYLGDGFDRLGVPVDDGLVEVGLVEMDNEIVLNGEGIRVGHPSPDGLLLASHTFYSKNAWNTAITIKFNSDSTGSRHITQEGSDAATEDSFNWESDENKLSFSFDETPDLYSYEEGLIVGVLDKSGALTGYGVSITCGEGGIGGYSTGVYSIVE